LSLVAEVFYSFRCIPNLQYSISTIFSTIIMCSSLPPLILYPTLSRVLASSLRLVDHGATSSMVSALFCITQISSDSQISIVVSVIEQNFINLYRNAWRLMEPSIVNLHIILTTGQNGKETTTHHHHAETWWPSFTRNLT
jgi:hypothetical protein